jgi:hypothetical protein
MKSSELYSVVPLASALRSLMPMTTVTPASRAASPSRSTVGPGTVTDCCSSSSYSTRASLVGMGGMYQAQSG